MPERPERVITVAPMPPEKCAYALARYSRSPDSMRDSIEWVRTHDSQRFLEHFYFQYGHASIADLGHVVMCFEGISELAATEIEDEPLWDGQAKSSRYQDFSRSGFIVPEDLPVESLAGYREQAGSLLETYRRVHAAMIEFLRGRLPRPESMSPPAYERNIAARAFDVARYLLFFGVPTNIGQVTSIRTLEKQIRRLKGSEYAELRSLADEMAAACSQPPALEWAPGLSEPACPTLAKYTEPDCHRAESRRDLAEWARQNLPPAAGLEVDSVDLLRPGDASSEIAATLLYPVADRPFRELYDAAASWPQARRNEVIDVALRSRTRRDELLREFRGGLFAYDMLMDLGAYRDLHRHRRCQQYRQSYSGRLGYETPAALEEAGLGDTYRAAVQQALDSAAALPAPASHYLLPFATRSRFLFKMDFAEAEYICRVRSGVKGHFSYRKIAWEMKRRMERLEPELGRLIEATPPWVEDPLTR